MEGVIACTRAGKCREEVAARFASWRELQEQDKEKIESRYDGNTNSIQNREGVAVAGSGKG